MDLEQDFNIQNREELSSYIDKKVKENLMQSLEKYIENLKEDLTGEHIVMKEFASIDRIEENIAVCELSDGTMLDIPTTSFGFDISQGDIINLEISYKEGNIEKIVINGKDEEEKQRRLDLINQKLNEIRNK